MTTDEVQQTGERPQSASADDDEFSSERYATRHTIRPPEHRVETVILGKVTGELDSVVDTEDGGSDDHGGDEDTDDRGDTGGSGDDGPDSEADAATMATESTGGEPDDAGSTSTADDTYLEMRQVAGLTAGSMMKLTVGRAFEFNESNEGGSFSLRVLENGEVVVHPGSARAVIDEIEVDEPMLVGDALLNVSSACFSVRRPRPPASSESRMEAIAAAFASISAVDVPTMGAEEPLPPEQLRGSRLGTIINRNPLTRGAVGQNAMSFLQSIRQTRSVVAERHRLMHPDPEELKTRLSRLDPGLWERSRQHSLFGRFGIGYANIPWEPRFDNPELIPEILHEPIVEMSLLPWVPVTANLLYGPLGIVGRRAARLAACRHAILSLAALSMPGEVQLAIRSGKHTATSWNWTRALPPVLSSDENSPFVVTIIDGSDGARADEAVRLAAYDEAGSHPDEPSHSVEGAPETADVDVNVDNTAEPDHTSELPTIRDDDLDLRSGVQSAATGFIVLADSLEELTQPCGTVLQIEPDGTGSVTNHLNETIQVTPIGVTEAFAHDMATRIADILTESFL